MVGKCFAAQSCRVLFVGKVARGKMEGSDDYGSFQVGFVSARSLWNSRKWAFWSYTQAIAQQLFPGETFRRLQGADCYDQFGAVQLLPHYR